MERLGTGYLPFESRLEQLLTAAVRSFGSQVRRKLFWQQTAVSLPPIFLMLSALLSNPLMISGL